MNLKKIYYLNKEKDSWLIEQALLNSQKEEIKLDYQQLNVNQDLYNNLCTLVAESFLLANQLGATSYNENEISKTNYQGGIYSLITKWERGKTGLLQAWSELGCRLARTHYFTNGNKRTALLAVSFYQVLWFSFKRWWFSD